MNRFLCLALALASSPLRADWPQFLGPQRDGAAQPEVALLKEFPAAGPQQLWEFPCGPGFAGPVVQGDRVYLFHRVGADAVLDCLAEGSGKVVWSYRYATNYKDTFGFDPGPRSTPTLTRELALLHGAEGQIHAVSLADGKMRWKRDLVRDFQSASGFFGRCGAPLVVGNVVVVPVGGEHEGKAVAMGAFSLADGKQVWLAGRQEAGYAAPQLLPGEPARVVCFLRDGLLVVDAKDGKEHFQHPFRSDNDASVNASTPVMLGEGRFFASACYDVGAGVWQANDQGWKTVWQATERLDCHYGTPVLHEGNLYGMHGRQESGMELRCVAAATGKVLWKSPALAAAEVLRADGKLLCLTDQGELILAALNASNYQELDRAQVLRAGHRAPPALSKGVLYARDGQKLVALQLRGDP